MLVKEQPKVANNNQPVGKGKGKGKIMTVDVEQDDVEDQVVRGTFLINNLKVHVSSDLGCTHFLQHVKQSKG